MAEIEIARGVRDLPREEWNALVRDDSPFLEWEWLASLEESGAVSPEKGWQPSPLLLREEGRLVAACPLYVKGHSLGEFVFDWSWADAAERASIPYYPKLLVGVPFTPATGSRLLVAADRDGPALQRCLAGALRDLCTREKLSGVHVNFCRPEELESLIELGFLPRIGLQYHWHNKGYGCFDDYLARLRSKRRNQIRRELRERERQGVTIEAASGDDIPDELFDAMFRFYRSTVDNHYWGHRYLNRSFFELLRKRFRRRLVFIVARRNEEPIAGTFNVAKSGVLYGRYWGALYPLRHLHFNVCYYAAVQYCIEAGLQRFEPGAGGDYKQLRGFDAERTLSGHLLLDPRLARAVGEFLDRERLQASESIAWCRQQSALKP